jgi:tetratricopeptide (TPR) repeat protein
VENGGKQNAFIGRTREISELRAALEDSIAGRGGCFLISGEPGIGKTRLADELAADAASRGARVAWGRCWEGGGAPAYWPWVEIVRSLVLESGRARQQQTAVPPEIGQLIPELAAETTQQQSSSDPEQGRFRLFDAVATLVKQVARSTPVVLILDDLHEADRGSLEMLKFIARGLTDSRVVIVGTYRDAEVRRSSYLAESISEIVRHGHPMPLAGLAENEVTQMIEHRAERSPSAAFASELHRVTAGNPLFVDGVIRVLVAERKLGTAEHLDLSGFQLPEGVRGAIRKRLALLSAQARSAMAVAAVIGQEFDLALLERINGESAGTLAELMREAAEVGIVAAASRESFRFTHPLIREALYKDSTNAARGRLHRGIAEALEEIHAANLTPQLAALANHFREAGDAEKAIDYLSRAGDEARRVFAHEEAVSRWSAALELVEEFGGNRQLFADLHLRLGELIGGQGERARRLEHLEEALRIYEELGDAHGAALLHLSLGINLSLVGLARAQDIPRAADYLRRAEAVLSEGLENADLVRLYFSIGMVAARSCRVRDAVVAFRHSMEIAQRIGHSEFWAMSAGSLTWILPQTGKIGEALEVLAQVWSKLDILKDTPGTAFAAVGWAGYCLMQLWDPRGAQKWWGTEVAKSRLGSGQRKVFMRLLQDAYLLSGDSPAARSLLEQEPHASAAGMLAFYEGDWDRADSILEQGLERARSGLPGEMLLYGQALARVRCVRGEPARAGTLLRDALRLYPEEEQNCQVEMVVRPELALVYFEMGRLEDAVAEVSRCREVSAGEDWRGLGGHLARAGAAVAAGAGELDAALAGFEIAVTIFRKYALPWEEADTLHRWGRALLAAGALDRANQKFDAAIEIYRRYGAGERWLERVQEARGSLPRKDSTVEDQPASSSSPAENIFRKDGDFWTVTHGGRTFRLRNLKGLEYIAYLLAHPGVRIHACDLVAMVEGRALHDAAASVGHAQAQGLVAASDLGDAGEALDAQAVSSYRRRLTEVRAELAEAERNNDTGAKERAQREFEALSDQLASAVGRHGRVRRSSSHVERARALVTKNIRASVERIRRNDAKLAEHFASSIRTGAFCAYLPQLEDKQSWQM